MQTKIPCHDRFFSHGRMHNLARALADPGGKNGGSAPPPKGESMFSFNKETTSRLNKHHFASENP